MIEFVLARYNYWIVIILMMTGLYIVFSRGHLVKTLIGLNLFQTSVFIFYITIGKVVGGTAPILIGGHGTEEDGHQGSTNSEAPIGAYRDNSPDGYAANHAPAETQHGSHEVSGTDTDHGAETLDAAHGAVETLYSNPLPHVLILTAIVVGVATTAVGLSLAVRIREAYGTVEEGELAAADGQDEVLELGR